MKKNIPKIKNISYENGEFSIDFAIDKQRIKRDELLQFFIIEQGCKIHIKRGV